MQEKGVKKKYESSNQAEVGKSFAKLARNFCSNNKLK